VRVSASDFAEEAVKAVNSGCAWEKHERALSGNHCDSVLAAEFDSIRAHGAFAHAAVHPNLSYARFEAVCDYRVGDFRRGHQKRCFDRGLDVLNASEAVSP
jgi:hypothetical protein